MPRKRFKILQKTRIKERSCNNPPICLVVKTRGAMVTNITLVARLQKLVERLPSQRHALNHARLILLDGRNMVLLKFVEEFLSQITSQSRHDGI